MTYSGIHIPTIKSEIINGLDVGNVLSYDLPADLPDNSLIYVTILPYNTDGIATGCSEESFTTENIIILPNCTTLNSPLNGALDVSVATDLSWDAVSDAIGYVLNVGSTPGGSDILNGFDVGNVSIYDLGTDLPENSMIYVTIVPYNTDGAAIGCFEERFTTEDLIIPPNCTSLISPSDGLTGVRIDTGLMWNAVQGAEGYLVTIATTSGGTDILDALDVGNNVFYDLETILPEDTRIYVTITAYNADGLASGCTEQSFETQSIRDRIPRFFTPNNDGDNDFWIIPNEFDVVQEVLIFNRYGKILDKISNTTTQMSWDGTYNGAFLPSSDYWYSIQLKDGEVLSGHFSLKR